MRALAQARRFAPVAEWLTISWLSVGGEVDVAVSTPAGFARMALDGRGLFADEPLPTLRAIGSIPHRDAMLVAIPAHLGIKSSPSYAIAGRLYG